MRFFFPLVSMLFGSMHVMGAEPLTRCSEVRSLTRERAAEGREVVLRGVITSGQKTRQGFVLHDGESGVYVIPAARTEWVEVRAPETGVVVEVRGVTGPGGFAPLVVARRVQHSGTQALPPPSRVTLSDLRTGAFDCQQAELVGVVQRWHRDEQADQFWLQVADQGGSFSVVLDEAADMDGSALVDAEVRVQGTCFSFFNTRGEIVGVRLRLARREDIAVVKAALSDPFAAPEVSRFSLRPFQRGAPSLHRQRLAGVVTLVRDGEFVYLQTKARAFRVNTGATLDLKPGDAVEAAGFVGPTVHFAMMDDALLRRTGTASLPTPMAVSSAEILLPKLNQGRELSVEDYDGALVSLRGRLVRAESPPGQETKLYLDCGGALIGAELAKGVSVSALQMESEVEVTGVCRVMLDQAWPADVMPAPAGFSLLLRDMGDVRVVRVPSWWTRERVLWLLGGVGALATVIAAWAVALRRRVVAQTEVIRQKVERESVLGERERIARELHDTLEQELMGVNMLLEEATTQLPRNAAHAGETLSLAHRMLRHCRAESRSSIRDLRSMSLENLGLSAALDDLLRPVATMNGATFAVATEGEACKLPISTETALLRIAHEAVANAARHSGAAQIFVALKYEPGRVRLDVRDDGAGFDPAAPRSPGEHFGLLGMDERANKIGGELRIDSTPGRGTTVSIHVPTV